MWFHETSLEFSLGIKLYSKKSLSICLFIHISWEPFFCAICYFAAVLLRTKGSAVSKLGQFGNVTHSILIHLNTGLQCSVFIAPQPEAGLTRDLCHMISRWSRHKQNEDLCSTTCCCNPFEMRKKKEKVKQVCGVFVSAETQSTQPSILQQELEVSFHLCEVSVNVSKLADVSLEG